MKSWGQHLFTIHYLPFTQKGFTLSEVLITLGIIGVVAAMTIPTLMNSTQEQEFKTGYKKAYSVLSQTLEQANNDQALTPFSGTNGGIGLQANFAALQQYFSIAKVCDNTHLSDCWDTSNGSEAFRSESTDVPSFIDKSGMAWRMRLPDTNGMTPMILVDINGNKKPNKYGQDRFPLFFSNTSDNNGNITAGLTGIPTKIVPSMDWYDNSYLMCPSFATHPCYYTKWLYN